jgi:hypothetical protein
MTNDRQFYITDGMELESRKMDWHIVYATFHDNLLLGSYGGDKHADVLRHAP